MAPNIIEQLEAPLSHPADATWGHRPHFTSFQPEAKRHFSAFCHVFFFPEDSYII